MRFPSFEASAFALLAPILLTASSVASYVRDEPVVGMAAPPIAFTDTVQISPKTDVSWEALRGTVVVLEFWATWCAPCVAAIPHTNRLAEEFADKAVRFIAISNEERDQVERLLLQHPMRSWVMLDQNGETFSRYGVRAIPQTFLIDQHGTIAGITHPGLLTAEMIQSLLDGHIPDLSESVTDVISDDNLKLEASIRGGVHHSYPLGGEWLQDGHFAATILGAFDFKEVIATAYQTTASRVLGADEFTGAYTLSVRVPGAHGRAKQLLRNALELSFGFEVGHALRKIEVYELRLSEDGSHRLRAAGDEDVSTFRRGFGFVEATTAPVSELARSLEWMLQQPVSDETGLDTPYTYRVQFQPGLRMRSWDSERRYREINTALQNQLGLRLVRTTREVECLVVSLRDQLCDDHAISEPSESIQQQNSSHDLPEE